MTFRNAFLTLKLWGRKGIVVSCVCPSVLSYSWLVLKMEVIDHDLQDHFELEFYDIGLALW